MNPETTNAGNHIDLTNITKAKGTFVGVKFKTTKKPAAAFKGTVLEKVTAGVFRAGINFANLKTVKDGIEAGERNEVGPLPWGEWTEFPYLIGHKGETYVRLYPTNGTKVEVEHFVNGVKVDKDEFNKFLTPADAKPNDKPLECFTVKAANILEIA